ncbi:cation:proton antiporter [Anaerotignum lactatifermentans]|uniref:Sodium/proton-potassium antiporter GerN, CPA2 family n=1 Tax=Anaerotignum lactatifermentans DSM 14214 TaxID=1121323 RepID=A0A1M6TW24_9FIRM|nr:cation:proton antiporter [Anaerotignum lactatifermentans]SHK61141.1 sodium/proton-potassium antiporter GerN, CPA2 family [[Clostridium] lactatifermentans DSM 14214] [Anaerotignum lactatifermentans DSM 14214]
MESYDFLLFVAIILLSTKIFSLLSRKVNMPQVVGALLVGVLLGPSCLNILHETDFLTKSAEIGVIFLMFLAGLDTDFDGLKATGKSSVIIAFVGVLIPLGSGFLTYYLFFHGQRPDTMIFLESAFVGIVLTATSVSITVETLREMGKLKGKMGTSILGAAIIDDILGIIALTVITSFTVPGVDIMVVLLKILLFFVFIAVCGFFVFRLFRKLEIVYGTKRRVAIYAVAFCLLLSYISEVYFGVADITGTYFAGLILCNVTETKSYIASKINITSYMFFTPIFFASIGIKTVITGMSQELILFTLALLIVAILSKIVGCGLGAKICGFSNMDSLAIGVGMISRGEVALIVAQKGEQAGLISPTLFPAIVLVVIVTTLITPILLKAVVYMKEQKQVDAIVAR